MYLTTDSTCMCYQIMNIQVHFTPRSPPQDRSPLGIGAHKNCYHHHRQRFTNSSIELATRTRSPPQDQGSPKLDRSLYTMTYEFQQHTMSQIITKIITQNNHQIIIQNCHQIIIQNYNLIEFPRNSKTTLKSQNYSTDNCCT